MSLQQEELETVIMKIIAHSGEARSKAFEALSLARRNEYKEADQLLQESKDSSVKAHEAQTGLLFLEAQGKGVDVNVLLVHAQDHLMSSVLAQELIQEMVQMYQEMRK